MIPEKLLSLKVKILKKQKVKIIVLIHLYVQLHENNEFPSNFFGTCKLFIFWRRHFPFHIIFSNRHNSITIYKT